MLIADKNGSLVPPARSKRRNRRPGLSLIDSSRHTGTGIPALSASVKATASHATVFTSSTLFETLQSPDDRRGPEPKLSGVRHQGKSRGPAAAAGLHRCPCRQLRVQRQIANGAIRLMAGFSWGPGQPETAPLPALQNGAHPDASRHRPTAD